MEELSIKIRIADREYPMKVKREDEEKVRMASRLINEKLKSYKDQFGIDDKQDLMAMVAFDSLVEKMTTEESHQKLITPCWKRFRILTSSFHSLFCNSLLHFLSFLLFIAAPFGLFLTLKLFYYDYVTTYYHSDQPHIRHNSAEHAHWESPVQT